MSSLLEFQDISMYYHDLAGETAVLQSFSMKVERGEFVALLGPSGCGKSTILSLAAGLLRPDSGRVLLRGEEIIAPPFHMGYMLQRDQLFPWLSVRENARLGLRVRGMLGEESQDRVETLLKACGLADFANAFPRQLSGGMRQRVALVRTLAVDPEFLLLDEPFSALDAQTRLKLADEVKLLIQAEGRAALLVSHDIAECVSMAGKVVVLSKRPARIKRVVEIELEGTPLERRGLPRFREYFDFLWKELDVHVD
ncbi:MAG: ABC transporter ATP-binding protein [Christensenellaceae bacterium]|nr:ABC transporter ATP-binding protein [Christensenellaceae bacterium]